MQKECRLTIIEAILIIAIVASIVLTIIPLYESASIKGTVTDEGGRLASFMRKVQGKSISAGREYRIRLVPEKNMVVISYMDAAGEEKKAGSIMLDDSVDLVATTFCGDTFSFNPLGTPSQGGSIELRDKADRKIRILISPEIGRITVEKME